MRDAGWTYETGRKCFFFAGSSETVRITGFHPILTILRELSELSSGVNPMKHGIIVFELWAKNMIL